MRRVNFISFNHRLHEISTTWQNPWISYIYKHFTQSEPSCTCESMWLGMTSLHCLLCILDARELDVINVWKGKFEWERLWHERYLEKNWNETIDNDKFETQSCKISPTSPFILDWICAAEKKNQFCHCSIDMSRVMLL